MYCEASGLSSRLASVVFYDGGTDRVLNGGRRLVMVSVCRSAQKRFGYDCTFCKIIQWFRRMCVRMVVALRLCIANLRFEVSRGTLRVAGRQAAVNNDCIVAGCVRTIYSIRGVLWWYHFEVRCRKVC